METCRFRSQVNLNFQSNVIAVTASEFLEEAISLKVHLKKLILISQAKLRGINGCRMRATTWSWVTAQIVDHQSINPHQNYPMYSLFLSACFLTKPYSLRRILPIQITVSPGIRSQHQTKRKSFDANFSHGRIRICCTNFKLGLFGI